MNEVSPDGEALDAYRRLRGARPELFKTPSGEAIVLLPESQWVKTSDGKASIGVLYEDEYIVLVKDPVRFPSGRTGTYIRILPASGQSGVAVLPTLDSQIVLVRHFRHATRDWHWEIPRGFRDPDDATAASAATRELTEEIGSVPTALTLLGKVHPNTGLSAEFVELFLAVIPETDLLEQDEGITEVRLVGADAIDRLIMSGELTDSFTIAALMLARLHGLLPESTVNLAQ